MEKHLPVECLKMCHYSTVGVEYPGLVVRLALKKWPLPEGVTIDNAWSSGASLVLHCEGCTGADHIIRSDQANKSAEIFLHEEGLAIYFGISDVSMAGALKAVKDITRLRDEPTDDERIAIIEEIIAKMASVRALKKQEEVTCKT